MIGIQKEALSGEDILDLSFILHGAMAIIEQQKEQYSFDFINALPDRPLGQGILQTLETLVIKPEFASWVKRNPKLCLGLGRFFA